MPTNPFAIGVVTALIIELWKRSPLPVLTASTETLNRWVSIAAAFILSLGIRVIDGDVQHGYHIFFPPPSEMLSHFMDVGLQWSTQHIGYKTYKVIDALDQKMAYKVIDTQGK